MAAASPPTSPPDEPPVRWTWREWSAIAAALVLGILLGPAVLRSSQPLPFVDSGGRVVAIGSLDAALMTQPAGAAARDDAGTTIGMSFRNAQGQYCRSFALLPGPAGFACRERGEWVVEVLARNPRPRSGAAPDGYRQAGTPFPAAVRDAIAARIAGGPLTPDDETLALAQGWRASARSRALKGPAP